MQPSPIGCRPGPGGGEGRGGKRRRRLSTVELTEMLRRGGGEDCGGEGGEKLQSSRMIESLVALLASNILVVVEIGCGGCS